MKHIIDHPKTRSDSARLGQFTRLDRYGPVTEDKEDSIISRSPRTRDASEKLRRFTRIARQSD